MKNNLSEFFLIVIINLFVVTNFFAQKTNSLKLEDIMKGEAFTGFSPTDIMWSDDATKIYFSWNPDNALLRDYYYIYADKGANQSPIKVDSIEIFDLPVQNAVYNSDYSLKLYSKNEDLFIKNLNDQTVLQITNTLDVEIDPVFLADESIIAYKSNNNIYFWNRKTGQTQQITDFRTGKEKPESTMSDQDKWIQDDNISQIQTLRQRKELEEARRLKNEKTKVKRPKPIYIGDQVIFSLKISADGRFVYYTLRKSASGRNTVVPDYLSKSGYASTNNAREKVGSPQDIFISKIYDSSRDLVYDVKFDELPGIFDKPSYLLDYNKSDSSYSKLYSQAREVIAHGPFISNKTNMAVYDIKSLDNKDRWIAFVDNQSGKLTVLDNQHDDAWIGGPGVESWKEVPGNVGWQLDGEWFWFQSEKSGYSHLYKVNVNTLEVKTLTSGKWEVTDAFLSKDGKYFYLSSSEVDPGERHFYKMSNSGGQRTKITTLTGNNEVNLSPDEKYLAIRFSYSNKPWELYLQKNDQKSTAEKITDSRSQNFKKYNWKDPELVYFTSKDGSKVRARLYKPNNEKKNGPAVIFVHGAGNLQNVHKWWSTYQREYMFHNMLTDLGYTVLDIDYRGSAGYGSKWRTGIYRHMGGLDLSDHVDGAKYLKEKHGIAEDKIGIYGGSYGGFITLMAMFKSPNTFKAGAALRSVTDWAHYNHPYTSNILNTPVEDSIAYKRSSPIYFADGLKGKLLILHGVVDDNVQFQDVVRLNQKLIELGKNNWEMAIYPMESHGFVETSSWIDEYKRILNLFEETIGNKRKTYKINNSDNKNSNTKLGLKRARKPLITK